MTKEVQIQPHTSTDYAALSPLRDMTDAEVKCLDELGAFLVSNDLHGRFAVSLLHRHFAVSDNELFIESPLGDVVTVQPVSKDGLDESSLTPINCRFVQNAAGDVIQMTGLEYAATADLAGTAPISEGDGESLAALRDILARNNAVDTFGVMLRHDSLAYRPDRIWAESNEHANRVSTNQLVAPEALTDAVDTVWIWEGFEETGILQAARHTLKACNNRKTCETEPEPGEQPTPTPDPEPEPGN
jgi:hypothetical protein